MRYVDEQGERLSDDELVVAMCRGGSDDGAETGDAGVPPYRLMISTCRSCARSFQITAGRELEVPASTVAIARCDARDIGDVGFDLPQRAVSSVTPRMREHVLARDHFMCTVPGCRSKRNLDVHHVAFESEGGEHVASNLTTACTAHHAQLHEGRLLIHGRAPHALEFMWPTDASRTSTRKNGW
jgi:hypothetical protein